MKKFHIIISLLFAFSLLHCEGTDKNAVRATVNEMYRRMRAMDIAGANAMFTRDFTSKSYDGKTVNRRDLDALSETYKRLAAAQAKLQAAKNSNDLIQVAEAVLSLQGITLDDAQKETFKNLPPDQKQQMLATMKHGLELAANSIAESQNKAIAMFNSVKIISVEVNGSKATVQLTYTDPEGKKIRQKMVLIKTGGKWFIRSTASSLASGTPSVK